MGSEDLFHKRKARTRAQNQRRAASRKPYDRVLIVCEGEKTEPIYFEEARLAWEIDSANIVIDGDCDSSPKNIVKYAKECFDSELRSHNGYDRVFCVFDRDSHDCFDEAIAKVDVINRQLVKDGMCSEDKPIFTAIFSVPSFEYWLLIHFTPSTKPYSATHRKSIGDQVIDDLKLYLPDYKKTQRGVFNSLLQQGMLDGAIANAKRILASAKKNQNNNPSTNVHELIEYLRDLKK